MSSQTSNRRRAPAALVSILLVVAAAGLVPPLPAHGESSPPDHLVISEVVTGGSSASDEIVEIYNPTASPLPLEGLELIYVTASGATVSRRVSWAAGAPEIPPARHFLVANELGIYAPIADATYASGMAATGGSVALRIQGASGAIDAVGWGNALNAWMEGMAAPAPEPGGSLERLPGGAAGSGVDSGDNAADFARRSSADPQNSTSPPTPDPSATPPPTAEPPTPAPSVAPTATAAPTAPPTTAPSTSASPAPSSTVASARAAADGTRVTIEAVATSGSTFTEGGGYVADESGGIAVIVSDGSFERGQRLRLTGTVSDRYAQRTLRVAAADLAALGAGSEPPAVVTSTGSVGEALEAQLARVTGVVAGAPTALAAGLAFDLDDGSGIVRVLVADATGISLDGWQRGATVSVVGIVGQRDATGGGSSGYRLQPRDPLDVISVTPPVASPTPSPTPDGEATPTPSLEPGLGVVPIADARAAPKNARVRVRGVVTLGSGLVDPGTAVVQDASGAIVLRLAEEAGTATRGSLVEVDGARSTKAGMETLRVTTPIRSLGSAAEPAPAVLRSGEAGEAHEATLVVVRGALIASARRSATGSVSFELDDGSGPLRVHLATALAGDDSALAAGTWVEVRGVLGQETTGAQPLRGYRVWPREASDLRILAAPTGAAGDGADPSAASGSGVAAPSSDLADVPVGLADPGLRIGATLVAGPWPELGIGGVLWDGAEAVAVTADDGPRLQALLGGAPPPLALELVGLRRTGGRAHGLAVVALGDGAEAARATSLAPHPPAVAPPAPGGGARWMSLVGRLSADGAGERLVPAGAAAVLVERRCDSREPAPTGTVGILGLMGAQRPLRLVAPCGAIVPAPALARAVAATGSSDGFGPGERAPLGTAAAVATGPAPSGVAALLLAAGALGLGGSAVAWRLRHRRPDPDDPEEAVAAEGDAAHDPAGDGADADRRGAGSPPALTLVSVRREHGP